MFQIHKICSLTTHKHFQHSLDVFFQKLNMKKIKITLHICMLGNIDNKLDSISCSKVQLKFSKLIVLQNRSNQHRGLSEKSVQTKFVSRKLNIIFVKFIKFAVSREFSRFLRFIFSKFEHEKNPNCAVHLHTMGNR